MAVPESTKLTTEALRQIPLAVVIPAIWPEATHERQGAITRWTTPKGKLNVKVTGRSDEFKVWSGPHAGKAGVGALSFLQDMGVCATFNEARDFLSRLDPARVQDPTSYHRTTPAPDKPKKPYAPPLRIFNVQKNLSILHDYLVTERKLPTSLIQSLAAQPHPPIYAGFGPRAQDYIVFPCRDHSLPTADSKQTGAILRWRHPGTPPRDQYGGDPHPLAPGTTKSAGWWQIGSGRDVLVVVEAPIDGLSILAALPPEQVSHVSILATGGTGGVLERQFHDYNVIITATDRDGVGGKIAQEVEGAAHRPTIRVAPPASFKDWNDVWKANPGLATETWAQAFRALEQPIER